MGERVTAIDRSDRQVTSITTDSGEEVIAANDNVVLAVPPWAAKELMPQINGPNEFAPIVNVHFRLGSTDTAKMQSPLLGLVGSVSHWVFARDDVVSVTVSAAHDLAAKPGPEIAETVWREVSQALEVTGHPMPKVRIIKERRATFLATARQLSRRPSWRTEVEQSGAGRRLDRHRSASDDRRGNPVRRNSSKRSQSADFLTPNLDRVLVQRSAQKC